MLSLGLLVAWFCLFVSFPFCFNASSCTILFFESSSVSTLETYLGLDIFGIRCDTAESGGDVRHYSTLFTLIFFMQTTKIEKYVSHLILQQIKLDFKLIAISP